MNICYRSILLFVHLVYSELTIISSCTNDAPPMILLRCKRIATHFESYVKPDYSIHSDPLILYNSIGDREGLCKAVINAKQFARVHNDRKTPFFFTDLTKFYGSSAKSWKLGLRIRECSLKQRWGFTVIKCLECVRAEGLRLFVALGQPKKFMYLLEQSLTTQNINYRMIGLLEPSAILRNDQSFKYFHDQIQKERFQMESICDLGMEDHIRICGGVFVALNGDNMLPMNYSPKQIPCINTILKGDMLIAHAKVLRCNLVGTQSNALLIDEFFILPDLLERAAVFVFLYSGEQVQRLPLLKLHTRALEVLALLTPLKPDKRQVFEGKSPEKQKKRMHQPFTNPEADKECTTSKTKGKVDKSEIDADSTKATKDKEPVEESDPRISVRSARRKKKMKLIDLNADIDSSVSRSFECETGSDTNLTADNEGSEEVYNSVYNEEEDAEQEDEEEEETPSRKKKKGV